MACIWASTVFTLAAGGWVRPSTRNPHTMVISKAAVASTSRPAERPASASPASTPSVVDSLTQTKAVGGSATLYAAPAQGLTLESTAPAHQQAALAAITKRLKQSFDPSGIFQPVRMGAGG